MDPAGTTIYVGGHYEVQSLGGKKTRDVTQLKHGVACLDSATGTGYLLYSAENVHSRFAAHPPHASNADHFVCVRYSGGWQYDTNSAYYSFTPRSSDVLVAAVDFTNDTVTSLAGQNSTLNGVAYGYASGNLTFEANVFAGVSNAGEFYLTGASLTTHSGGGSVLKYYFFNGQRVAMRQDGVVQYLLGDHLGTTSLALDASGNKVAEIRHLPYGGQRWTADGTLPTDYRWTGQRQDGYIKLYLMGARWYDSELGRWISPDSIVPDPANPQSLNRFAYVYNNPLGYIDSSGHAGEPWWKRLVNKIVDYWAPWTAPAITRPRVSPPTSDDMTSWLVGQMNTNAQAEVTRLIQENWVDAWPHQNAAALKAWTSLVRTGAVWDFKTDILIYNPNIENVQLGSRKLNYQAVANIHFGFVGRAAGFGSEILRAGAGIFQFIDWYDKDPSAVGPLLYETENGPLRTYFDQPFDAWCVAFGIYLYEMYVDNLTEETFEQALQEFIEVYGEPPPLE